MYMPRWFKQGKMSQFYVDGSRCTSGEIPYGVLQKVAAKF